MQIYGNFSIFATQNTPPLSKKNSNFVRSNVKRIARMNSTRTEKEPLISIITVTYNASSTIGETMKSVSSQKFTDYEHIIMDGVSTDATLSIAEDLKTSNTHILSSPDHGIYDAMNKAMGVARGQYLLFLNSGDTFANVDVLQRYADAIVNNSYPGIVYGVTVLVDSHRKIVGRRHLEAPRTLSYDSFRKGMVVCHQAFMVARAISPLYNLKYRFSADYEWCIRCLQNTSQAVYIGDEPAIHYLNEGLTTRNHKASLWERFQIMCDYFGTVPTIIRHLRFLGRYMRRRKNSSNIQ